MRACRVSAGFTQQRIADSLGKDVTYVSKVENGKIIPDAEIHYLWIEITESRHTMFSYIYRDGGSRALQNT